MQHIVRCCIIGDDAVADRDRTIDAGGASSNVTGITLSVEGGMLTT